MHACFQGSCVRKSHAWAPTFAIRSRKAPRFDVRHKARNDRPWEGGYTAMQANCLEVLGHYCRNKTTKALPRSGRPTKLTERVQELIKQSDDETTVKELALLIRSEFGY